MATIKRSEVKKGIKAVRAHLRCADRYLDAGDQLGARSALEHAQLDAFETKNIVTNGGDFETYGTQYIDSKTR